MTDHDGTSISLEEMCISAAIFPLPATWIRSFWDGITYLRILKAYLYAAWLCVFRRSLNQVNPRWHLIKIAVVFNLYSQDAVERALQLPSSCCCSEIIFTIFLQDLYWSTLQSLGNHQTWWLHWSRSAWTLRPVFFSSIKKLECSETDLLILYTLRFLFYNFPIEVGHTSIRRLDD